MARYRCECRGRNNAGVAGRFGTRIDEQKVARGGKVAAKARGETLKPSSVPALMLLVAVTLSALSGCVTYQSAVPATGVPTRVADQTTTEIPVPASTNMRGVVTPFPTLENDALGLCTPIEAGSLNGRLTRAGRPVPDGVFAGADFDGGPFVDTRTKDSNYSLPLLARRCPDGLHWVGLILWTSHVSKAVVPDGPDMRQDIDLPATEALSIPSTPSCRVAFGQIKGSVLQQDRAAPDGIPILVARVGEGTGYPLADPDKDYLTQKTYTRSGQYALISVGLSCGDGSTSFPQATLFAPGVSIPITPTQAITTQDIILP